MFIASIEINFQYYFNDNSANIQLSHLLNQIYVSNKLERRSHKSVYRG
jgi:hypothetical protein